MLKRKAPPTATYVYDLDHNPLKRPRVSCCHANQLGGACGEKPKQVKGSLLCMLSHGCVWHDTFKRSLSSSEWCQLHGYPTESSIIEALKFPLDFRSLLQSKMVSPVETMSMMGNGWHLPSVGPWILWVMSSIESMEDVIGAPRPAPSTPCTETDIEDESFAMMQDPLAAGSSPLSITKSQQIPKVVQVLSLPASWGTPLKMGRHAIDISDSDAEDLSTASNESI